MKGRLPTTLKKVIERTQDLLNVEEELEVNPVFKAWVGLVNQHQ